MVALVKGPETIERLPEGGPQASRSVHPLHERSLLCLGGGLAALLAGGYLPEHKLERGEFYSLLIFATVGAMILAASGDLLSLFLGLETMSLGVVRDDRLPPHLAPLGRGGPQVLPPRLVRRRALLYGFALLYGATGHTDLAGHRREHQDGRERPDGARSAWCSCSRASPSR
jgi:NADH-quinone oxidoreductase subunit N